MLHIILIVRSKEHIVMNIKKYNVINVITLNKCTYVTKYI